MRNILVGCAGWSIPAPHRELFAEGESVLARYASLFSAVEINSSFYRPHRRSTYERWSAAVPRHFRFSVKVPRSITHEGALRRSGPDLDAFLYETAGLAGRLGGYLLQLPPSQALDTRVAATFFRMFRGRSDAKLACEPRHASWFSCRADELLIRYKVSRVRADPPVALPPPGGRCEVSSVEAIWPYWRWHGSPRKYYSAYTQGQLERLAGELTRTIGSGAEAWVIFDNTAHGFATPNAMQLGALMRLESRP